MALFSAAHFAKKRFSTFTQLRHLCRVFAMVGGVNIYIDLPNAGLCSKNGIEWYQRGGCGTVDTNLLTEAPVGPQCFLYGKRAESLSASLGAAGKKL